VQNKKKNSINRSLLQPGRCIRTDRTDGKRDKRHHWCRYIEESNKTILNGKQMEKKYQLAALIVEQKKIMIQSRALAAQ